ncbi:rod shape-determining protein [Shigella flexneri]
MRRNYGSLIGEATAERIKHEIGSAIRSMKSGIEVRGRTLAEGVPRGLTLTPMSPRSTTGTAYRYCERGTVALYTAPAGLASDISQRLHGARPWRRTAA